MKRSLHPHTPCTNCITAFGESVSGCITIVLIPNESYLETSVNFSVDGIAVSVFIWQDRLQKAGPVLVVVALARGLPMQAVNDRLGHMAVFPEHMPRYSK